MATRSEVWLKDERSLVAKEKVQRDSEKRSL